MKALHLLALLLFLLAGGLYLASSITGAGICGGIALILEASAWVVALGSGKHSPPSDETAG